MKSLLKQSFSVRTSIMKTPIKTIALAMGLTSSLSPVQAAEHF